MRFNFGFWDRAECDPSARRTTSSIANYESHSMYILSQWTCPVKHACIIKKKAPDETFANLVSATRRGPSRLKRLRLSPGIAGNKPRAHRAHRGPRISRGLRGGRHTCPDRKELLTSVLVVAELFGNVPLHEGHQVGHQPPPKPPFKFTGHCITLSYFK